MTGIKLKDLSYGALNEIADLKQSQLTGDPRRTSTSTSLQRGAKQAYEPDTLEDRSEFNGFIVSYRSVTFPVYQNKASMLLEYTQGSTEDNSVQQAHVAYKVYIPELEPRPAPKGNKDPILRTYPDVYTEMPGAQVIPLGSMVLVRYENPATLSNPKIVKVLARDLQIENLSVDSSGQRLVEGFSGTTPTNLGALSANVHGSDEKYTGHIDTTNRRITTADMGEFYKDATFYGSYNWDGHKPSQTPNKNADASKIKWIVIHTTEISPGEQGNLDVLAGYRKGGSNKGKMFTRKASTQYFVAKSGNVYALMPDNQAPFAIGPTQGRVTNYNSINIEHEGHAADPNNWGDPMLRASAGLIKYLSDKFNIPLVYEGLSPGSYTSNSKGHPSLDGSGASRVDYPTAESLGKAAGAKNPDGTPMAVSQDVGDGGLISHHKARVPDPPEVNHKYDPGVYYPFQKVIDMVKALPDPEG